LLCMHTAPPTALWLAALAGTCTDLAASNFPGIYTLTFVCVIAFLCRCRLNFFKDQPLQLCFFTFLISILSTPIYLALLFLFDKRLPITGKWFLFDFFSAPLIDAAYAFFWFTVPLFLWEKIDLFRN
jgi:cell shape-determining protein MreD